MKKNKRKKDSIRLEKSPTLRILYNTKAGRVVLKAFVNPAASDLLGRFLSTKASAGFIPGFVRRTGIDTSKYEARKYRSYNDFFTRKLASAPCFSSDRSVLCSPCEGFLTAMEIHEDSIFEIKDTNYSIADLLCSRKLAAQYNGGTCLIFRLAVHNYHRYYYFDSGRVIRAHSVNGCLHTVRPIAFEHFDVYKHNCREYTVMETDNFGSAVQIEVGAMFVGRIVNYPAKQRFSRGEEKGYFEFGGSTVILLLKPGSVSVDKTIVQNSMHGIETEVAVGQPIGRSLLNLNHSTGGEKH